MLETVHVINATPTTIYVQSEVPTPWPCRPVLVTIEPGRSGKISTISAAMVAIR